MGEKALWLKKQNFLTKAPLLLNTTMPFGRVLISATVLFCSVLFIIKTELNTVKNKIKHRLAVLIAPLKESSFKSKKRPFLKPL